MVSFSKDSTATCLFMKSKEVKNQTEQKEKRENQYFGKVEDEGNTFQLLCQDTPLIK